MNIDQFCQNISRLDISNTDKALAILWFYDEGSPEIVMTAGEIARIITNSGLGSPHSTKLGVAIKRSGLVIEKRGGFSLKTLSRIKIRQKIEPALGEIVPSVDHELGYIPKAVWKGTRGYIEKVCVQLNGAFQFGFYDAASVMLRRIVETLIIEAYEYLNRESEIRDASGNYTPLSKLIDKAVGGTGLRIGRDTKRVLLEIKELGDRSAHNRRYNAVKADLEKVQSGFRVAFDDFSNLASLRSQV